MKQSIPLIPGDILKIEHLDGSIEVYRILKRGKSVWNGTAWFVDFYGVKQ